MKNKFWIKTRVFLSFWFLIIIITNIFATFLYIFVEKSFISNLKKNIEIEYQNFIKIIDNKDSSIINIPEEETSRLNDIWLFFIIANNEEVIKQNYLLWLYRYDENIIFRWDYNWYNILIWKNVLDLDRFKKNIIETTMLLNIFWLFLTLLISYFITNRVLNPLIKLSKYISNYDINQEKTFIINKYWSSEIWLITQSLNKFISKTKAIIDSQKDFIQDTSHELKTPLMQIETNIELIEDKITDKKIKEKLENIKQSTQNINNIISNLSFILRWEEKQYKKQEINIFHYLTNLKKDFIEISKQKNIKINVVENEKLIIQNNVYYLDRLFTNLINNSIYYNNWDSEIILNIYKDKIEVTDFGIWIEKREIEKIFSRFYRNKNSNIYNKNWNWLWLTIVKKICDNFGWEINIESEIWEKTKIAITIK